MTRTYARPSRTATLRPAPKALERKSSCGCGGRCAACSSTQSLSAPASGAAFDFGSIRIFPERARATHTLFETDQGTETASPAPTTTVDGGPAAPVAACSSDISGGSFSSIPSGQTLVAALSGNKLGRAFSMVATFVPAQAGCASECGEYRQYVRGQFTRNGTAVAHALCANNLDPTTYHEDCANIGGTIYKYGYHTNRFGTSYFDNPDQATGLTFHGYDEPGLTGASGDRLAMALDFRGELVNTCNGNAVLQTAEWSVGGTATVP